MDISADPRAPLARIVSEIPGRIRLRFAAPAVESGQMASVAVELRRLAGVWRVEVTPDACSVIVCFDRDREVSKRLHTHIRDFNQHTSAAPKPHTRREKAGPRALVSPGIPSRVESRAAYDGLLSGLTVVQRAASRKWERAEPAKSDDKDRIAAKDMPGENPRGIKGLVFPTLAVALAATEAVPLAIAGAALAAATIPIYQRAFKGVRQRQLTVDTMDFANVVLLALEGSLLPASAITWLIGLGELIRGETVRQARRETVPAAQASAALQHEDFYRLFQELHTEILSNTRSQHNALQPLQTASYPLAALGIVMAFVWRDPSVFIDVYKPRSDFEAATRFSIPTSLLNIITRMQRHGVRFGSAAAIEALSAADAFIFDFPPSVPDARSYEAAVAALLDSGARAVVLPSGTRSERIIRNAEAAGRPGIVSIEPRLTPDIVRSLREQQMRVAVVSDSADPRGEVYAAADVRVLTSGDCRAKPGTAEVCLTRGLADLPFAIDATRTAMHVVTENIAVAAGASAFNFASSLMQALPAPFSSLLNTIVIGTTAVNARRLLAASPASGRALRRRSTGSVVPATGRERSRLS